MNVGIRLVEPPKGCGVGMTLRKEEYKAATGISRFYMVALRGLKAHICSFNVGMAFKKKYGDLITVFDPKTGAAVGEESVYKDLSYGELKKKLSKYNKLTEESLPFAAKRAVIEAKLVELKSIYGDL